MQDQLFDMLVNKDEITWQTIIHDLVKSEQMDPWAIDITLLAEKYLETVKQLQEHNFQISGKVVLAAAIMLHIKTTKLLEEDIVNFDNILFSKEEDLLADDSPTFNVNGVEVPNLLIKTPQLRKRKVSLNDLMEALTMALKVEEKRVIRRRQENVIRHAEIPVKKWDLSNLMKELFDKVTSWFAKKEKLTFKELVPSDRKEDIITTFIPLLHLSNHQKVDLDQQVPFGDIDITMHKKSEE